jgi:hypothetical protein
MPALMLCFLALFTHGIPAQGVELQNQTLRYSVHYLSKNAGVLEIVINRSATEVKTTAISHLSLLAKMFLSGLTVETWFSIENQDAILARGNVLSNDNESVERSFDIDRQKGLIKFDRGDTVPIEMPEYFESTTFPIGLITSDITAINGRFIQEINPQRVSRYVYLAPEEVTLELNGRSFESWKVTRHKVGDTTRTVTMWLDKNNQQIPLKIVTTKKNKDTVMVLLPDS